VSGIRSFLGSKKNRDILAWLGGGLVAVVVALWTAFVYFHPPMVEGGEGKSAVTASHGGVSVGGNTNSTINTSPATGGESQLQGYWMPSDSGVASSVASRRPFCLGRLIRTPKRRTGQSAKISRPPQL